FLGKGNYEAFICKDNLQSGSYPVETEERKVNAGDTLNMAMLPSGGFVIRLTAK
ncbi:MAG: glycoside hydrolase family 97 C-terminal domain-containing protein, partial [Planctomycetes bacterium]|nr:glycoside hydrolase family 97 C-terminal domain-containing protein [Planctomycetota bacterium]